MEKGFLQSNRDKNTEVYKINNRQEELSRK
jgi:hypothetical protein